MRALQIVAAAIAAGALGACAVSPESIAPSYVSPITYQNLTCDQLGEEGHRIVAALSRASMQQEQARTGDVVGVIMLGLPVSTLSGQNIAPEVARLKGEHEAIYRAALTKGCATEARPPAAT